MPRPSAYPAPSPRWPKNSEEISDQPLLSPLPIATLAPDPKNPRRMSDAARAGLGVSMETFVPLDIDINRITGTQMAGHWFTKTQFQVISRGHYERIAAAADGRAFTESYDALSGRLRSGARSGGNRHRRAIAHQLRAVRTFFDNTHDAMTDVWQFPRVRGDERHGHATPKLVAMVARAMKSSSRPGDAVGAPFSGAGPELIAAEQLGRRCFAMELEPSYVDVAVARWERFSGGKARRVAAGSGRG
jgi:hypothetical protein